jgi:hypothetical protein
MNRWLGPATDCQETGLPIQNCAQASELFQYNWQIKSDKRIAIANFANCSQVLDIELLARRKPHSRVHLLEMRTERPMEQKGSRMDVMATAYFRLARM